ncbi:GNAT family N-acetyltransferase [Streptomyces sp. NPDC048332]|uniref:GNAT family N-acetyltransferase n=1 Tax=unclassified Streptomyces TaxID=2593676 RepID=UPI00343AC47C
MHVVFTDIAPGDPAMTTDVEPLIRTLRPSLGPGQFADFALRSCRQGLVFTAAHDGSGRCRGVVTHRTLATSRGLLLLVEDLVTDPALRGRGVGRQLMDEVERRARLSGCDRIELDTGTANHRAQSFYHSLGMRLGALHFVRDVASGTPDATAGSGFPT